MTYLILKSYFTLLLSISFGALLIFFSGLYFIFRKPRLKNKEIVPVIHFEPEEKSESDNQVTEQFIEETPDLIDDLPEVPQIDINSIAGEDTFATQLDLARAYIEIGSKQLAKKILDEVIAQGNLVQQNEARTLLLGLL